MMFVLLGCKYEYAAAKKKVLLDTHLGGAGIRKGKKEFTLSNITTFHLI